MPEHDMIVYGTSHDLRRFRELLMTHDIYDVDLIVGEVEYDEDGIGFAFGLRWIGLALDHGTLKKHDKRTV